MTTLLNKFDMVTIENDTRISEFDRKYCEKQERMYNEAVTAMKQTLELFKGIYENYSDSDKKNYKHYIDSHSDIRHIEDRLTDFKNSFIHRIISHFEKTYNVTLRDSDINRKYKDIEVTYNNIVDEIFEQLGGFNFEEKAVNELIKACKETVYNDTKIKVTKNKLSIQDFVYWQSYSWDNSYTIGYSDGKVNSLFKALSHFEEGSTDTLFYYDQIYEQLNAGSREYDILSKFEIGYNIVESIKFFKNGKVEIVFQTHEQAQQFATTYLLG